MAHVRWPARLQRLKHGSLVSLLKEGESLWLDGGHNPAAAEVIAAWARSQRDVGMVVGMLRRKDAAGFFEALRGADMALATIGMEEDGGYSAEELAGFSRGAATPYTSVEEALHGLHAQGCRCFIIGGSLYLAGKLLQNHS